MAKEKKPSSSNIFDKTKYADLRLTLDDAIGRSAAWYQARIAELKGITASQIMKDTRNYKTRISPGEIYCYYYSPKYKDKLPYYDMFPIVLPLKLYPDGFLGMNFHYIKPEHRIILFNEILQHGKGPRKTVITYEIIADFARSKYAEPTIKRYLWEQLGTPLRKIEDNDVITALIVPTEKFVKEKKTNVWKDYKKY